MNDESKPVPSSDSNAFGVSMRAWIAISLTITVCSTHVFLTIGTLVNAIMTKDFSLVGSLTTIGEPLYSMAVGALGFYFGQKNSNRSAPTK